MITDPNHAMQMLGRLRHLAIASLLVIGLVIGFLATWLHYNNGKQFLKQKLQYEIEQQVFWLETELNRMKNIALQVTSRTRIRQELEKYNRGEIGRDQLVSFSTPKLADAIRLSSDMLGITRLGRDLQPLIEVGVKPSRHLWPALASADEVMLGIPSSDLEKPYLVISAPIFNRNDQRVGTDLAVFNYMSLYEKLKQFENKQQAQSLLLFSRKQGEVVSFFEFGQAFDPADVLDEAAGVTKKSWNGSSLSIDESPDNLLFSSAIKGSDWSFLFSATASQLFSIARQDAMKLSLVVFFLMTAAIVVTYRLSKTFSRKISDQTRDLISLLDSNQQLLETVNARESQIQQIIDNAPAVIYVKDLDGRYQLVNSSFEEVLDTHRENVVGKTDFELLPESVAAVFRNKDKEVIQKKTATHSDDRTPSNSGHRDYFSSRFPLFDNDGNVRSICGISTDITERKQNEQKLRQSAAIFECTAEGIVLTDRLGVIQDVNTAMTDIMGYSREEMIGQTTKLWKSGRHSAEIYKQMWESIKQTGGWRGELWNKRKDGSEIPELVTISSVMDEQGQLSNFVAIYSDITHIKQSEMQLSHLAHHDSLTGLPNRLLFNDRLEHAIKRAARTDIKLAVIFLDLDQFKYVNDSLGHSMGDKLLIETAEMLKALLRSEDTIARIGGDEFTFLLEDISKSESVIPVIEKILHAFDRDFDIEGRTIKVTPSMGISIFPTDGQDADTLLRNADSAMYRSKSEGRNTYHFYTEEMTSQAFELMLLESSLRKAISENDFELFYQPQFDLKSRKLVGMEALIRWEHKEMGMVPPTRFITVAEDSGLILSLGEWILETACRQAKSWLDAGLSFGRLSINISGKQVGRGELPAILKRSLKASSLDARYIELEITESAIMGEASRAIDEMSSLREMGIALAIDDFGTGYSSLTYLKSLPIHRLKIDREFVQDLPNDPNDVAITRAVIALGKSLQLGLVAEGVESEEQAEFLLKEGCELAQGYYFSKPLPADAMTNLLEQQTDS